MEHERALLVLDVLEGIFTLGVELHEEKGFLERVQGLVTWARRLSVPLIFIRHQGPEGSPFSPGAPGGRIHPAVEPLPDEVVLIKSHPDAFQESDLEKVLRRMDAIELLVAGFATEGCVDTTVRSAYALGFRVVLVSDCHTTTDSPVLDAGRIIAHHNHVLRRFARVCPMSELPKYTGSL